LFPLWSFFKPVYYSPTFPADLKSISHAFPTVRFIVIAKNGKFVRLPPSDARYTHGKPFLPISDAIGG